MPQSGAVGLARQDRSQVSHRIVTEQVHTVIAVTALQLSTVLVTEHPASTVFSHDRDAHWGLERG